MAFKLKIELVPSINFMQTSTNVPAIMDVSTTVTTQLGPITALALFRGMIPFHSPFRVLQ